MLKKNMIDILGKAGLEIRKIPTTETTLRPETLFPAEASLIERELISKASKYSMTGIVRIMFGSWSILP
jgi:hypothetical protein